MVKSVATLCLALVLTVVARGDAHPLHSSFTEITRARDGNIAISIRLFADDFGVALDSLRAESHGATKDATAQLYLARSVFLTTAEGKQVPLAWCGMSAVDGLVWLCARSVAPVVSGRFRLRNALMFDRFRDQISIIKWIGGSETRTLVLSARTPEARLD